MKQSVLYFILLAILTPGFMLAQEATDATGFDGDNFSLEGALELLKSSESLEDFEERINKEDSYVNNLDLNEDGETDYIRVIDNYEDDVHAIVLQVPVSETENQDIAVIEVEKTGNENAVLQIIGDEDVFGEQTIVEPFDVESSDEGSGPESYRVFTRIIVNVWLWPSVRYIYRPSYRVWVSPYRWSYYPRWWKPWRPRAYHVFHPFKVKHRNRYHVVSTHRVVKARRIYTPKRATSKTVVSRTKVTRTKVGKTLSGKKVAGTKTTTRTTVKNNKGQTATAKKSKTQVAGKTKKGNKVKASKSTKTKAVKGKKGKAGTKKTKSKVRKKKG